MTPFPPGARSQTPVRKIALTEAAVLMGAIRLLIKLRPFRSVMGLAGQYRAESPPAIDATQVRAREEVAAAIDAVRLFTPWDSNCLAQALAGSLMLHRRGVSGTVYLGVAKDNPESLAAHAWLRSGDQIIAGEDGQAHYAVVGSFARQGSAEG